MHILQPMTNYLLMQLQPVGTSLTSFAQNLANVRSFYCNFKLDREFHNLCELAIQNLV